MKTKKIFFLLLSTLMVALACKLWDNNIKQMFISVGDTALADTPMVQPLPPQVYANPTVQTLPPPTSANPAIQPPPPDTPSIPVIPELINPGFEDGILGWAEDPVQFEWGGESVAETGVAHTGGQSRKLWLRWGGSNIGQRVLVELPAESQVSLTAWVMMPFPGEKTNKWFTLTLVTGAADGQQDMLFVDQMNALPNWTQLSVGPLITRFPVNWIEVRAQTNKGDGSNRGYNKPVWVDDFELSIQTFP